MTKNLSKLLQKGDKNLYALIKVMAKAKEDQLVELYVEAMNKVAIMGTEGGDPEAMNLESAKAELLAAKIVDVVLKKHDYYLMEEGMTSIYKKEEKIEF